MENENKEKKVILTDEELKEVASGAQCLPMGKRCSDLRTEYYCVQKEVCGWDKVKKVCTWAIYLK
jgi:hypothetical protein